MSSPVERYNRLRDAIQDRLGYFFSPPTNREQEAERDAAYATIAELTSTPIHIPGCDPKKWTHDLRMAAFRLTLRGPDIHHTLPMEGWPPGITAEHRTYIELLKEALAHLRTLPPEIIQDEAPGKVLVRLPLAGPHGGDRLKMLAYALDAKNLTPEMELQAFAEMVRTGLIEGRDLPTNQEELCGMMGEAGIDPVLYANGTLRPRDIVALWEGKRRQGGASTPPTPSSTPPAPTRKRGRPLESDPARDGLFFDAWIRAGESGVSFKDFCRDQKVNLREGTRILDRERKRRDKPE